MNSYWENKSIATNPDTQQLHSALEFQNVCLAWLKESTAAKQEQEHAGWAAPFWKAGTQELNPAYYI